LPAVIKKRIRIPEPLPFKVIDGYLHTGTKLQEVAWERYKKFLYRKEGRDRIRIKKGYEFQLIAKLIEDGCLPFVPMPVEEEDLREWNGIKLRSYQRKAWEKFLKCGAIGVFYPFGAGKSMFGLYTLGRIRGRKLVVVPTLTLQEQWIERIREFMPEYEDEIEVVTYLAYDKVKDKEYTLTIFDECHRLPANTYIRLSTIRTKYRIGLSGCVAKGTYILCNDEWRKIESLDQPDVYSFSNGNLLKTKALNFLTFWTPQKKPYKLSTYSGKTLLCTSDHPILTIDGWKSAEKLRRGDIVVVTNQAPPNAKQLKITFDEFLETYPPKQKVLVKAYYEVLKLKSEGKSWRKIRKIIKEKYGSELNTIEWLIGKATPIPIREWKKVKPLLNRGDLIVKLFGFALGDGNLNEQFRLTYTVPKEEVEPIISAFKELGISCSVYKKKGKNVFSVRPQLYAIGRIFNILGMPIGNKIEKRLEISPKIYPFTVEFLSGLFGADGSPPYLRRRKFIHSITTYIGESILAMNTTNASYLEGCFNLLSSMLRQLGIDSIYKIKKGWKRKNGEDTLKFELRIKSRLENMLKFLHLIDFAFSPKKQAKANKVLIKKKKLLEREEKVKRGEIPKRGKFVELRNVSIEIPSFINENIRIEMISESTPLKEKFPIFNLRVDKTENFVANGFIVHNSPFREDGRENYIFALTGFPIGLNWEELIKLKVVTVPRFKLYIVRDYHEKFRRLDELLKIPVKTLIFCDSIRLGKQIASRFGIPFVYSETRNRLEIIRNSDVCVVSRVADEGISVEDIERVIEVAFLYGSRRQESQRFGRLMHSQKEEPEHIIIMTEREFQAYQKRLYAIYERGFRIEVVR